MSQGGAKYVVSVDFEFTNNIMCNDIFSLGIVVFCGKEVKYRFRIYRKPDGVDYMWNKQTKKFIDETPILKRQVEIAKSDIGLTPDEFKEKVIQILNVVSNEAGGPDSLIVIADTSADLTRLARVVERPIDYIIDSDTRTNNCTVTTDYFRGLLLKWDRPPKVEDQILKLYEATDVPPHDHDPVNDAERTGLAFVLAYGSHVIVM